MRHWTRCTRTVRCLALAAALVVGSGCFGSEEELALYCALMSLVTTEIDFNSCYDYEPGEFQEMRQYLGDVREYQQLRDGASITAPGAPSFDDFMSARYADWPERSVRLQAIAAAHAARADAASTD